MRVTLTEFLERMLADYASQTEGDTGPSEGDEGIVLEKADGPYP